MSTGFMKIEMACKIGKKKDKSDCAKKDCEHCRHWAKMEVWHDCMHCMEDCSDCPFKDERK